MISDAARPAASASPVCLANAGLTSRMRKSTGAPSSRIIRQYAMPLSESLEQGATGGSVHFPVVHRESGHARRVCPELPVRGGWMSIVAIRRRVVSLRVDRMNRTKRRAVNTGARPVRASPVVSMHAKPGGSPLITFSEDALALVGEKQSPVFIDVPYTLRGCCFDMTECPAVRFGEPVNSSGYVRQDAQGRDALRAQLPVRQRLADHPHAQPARLPQPGHRRLEIDLTARPSKGCRALGR